LSEYPSNVRIHNKRVHFRKWKVKDKNKFLSNKSNKSKIKEALVYDCLKDQTAMSDEEYKFMLIVIRDASLPGDISYEFTCECGFTYDYIPKLLDVMKPVFKGYGNISTSGVVFEMQPVQNREFYDRTLSDCSDMEADLFDFLLHVKSLNQDVCLTFDQLLDFVNEMDVDVFEDVFLQWNSMKFRVNNVSPVTCPKCSLTQLYEFDDLPDFFPESWDV